MAKLYYGPPRYPILVMGDHDQASRLQIEAVRGDMGTMVRAFKVRSSTLVLVCLVLFAILITGIFSGFHHSYGVTTFEKLLLVTGLLSCLLYVLSVARGQEMRRRFDEYRLAEGKL